jgi:hypothetical protein
MPNESDRNRLIKLLSYLNHTNKDVLVLQVGSDGCIKWHVDASFAMHHDKKGHTGATMTPGKGSIILHLQNRKSIHGAQ